MPQECLTKQTLHAKGIGKRPVGQPQIKWFEYIEDLRWNYVGLQPNKMQSCVGGPRGMAA